MKRFLLFGLLSFFLLACSDVKMERDILAFHLYSQISFPLDSENEENVALLAKSFGMKESEIKDLQKFILSKKTETALRASFRYTIERKIKELSKKNTKKASQDFLVNVLAPYLNQLARNQLSAVGMESNEFQNKICTLYEKFFPEKSKNPLDLFIDDVKIYFSGGVSSIDHLHALNENLLKYGYYLDFELQSFSNLLKLQDELLKETQYKKYSVKILNLKRFIPSLLPPKSGYYAIGTNTVIVLDDMVEHSAKEFLAELDVDDFQKYTDNRFNRFWKSIGLDLDLAKASKIYRELVKRDFENKRFSYAKAVYQMDVAIHEAKHLVDNIEHPELTLNLDLEFNAHITEAIYSPAIYTALLSAINRMQNYAMFHQVFHLRKTTKKLWEFAIRAAEDPSYTEENLRTDLSIFYANYRTIREGAHFESLDVFEQTIITGLNHFYQR